MKRRELTKTFMIILNWKNPLDSMVCANTIECFNPFTAKLFKLNFHPGTEPRTLAWKAAVLTTTLGPPPHGLICFRLSFNMSVDGKQSYYVPEKVCFVNLLLLQRCSISDYPQFSTYSEWRWLEVSDKWKQILLKEFYEHFRHPRTVGANIFIKTVDP